MGAAVGAAVVGHAVASRAQTAPTPADTVLVTVGVRVDPLTAAGMAWDAEGAPDLTLCVVEPGAALRCHDASGRQILNGAACENSFACVFRNFPVPRGPHHLRIIDVDLFVPDNAGEGTCQPGSHCVFGTAQVIEGAAGAADADVLPVFAENGHSCEETAAELAHSPSARHGSRDHPLLRTTVRWRVTVDSEQETVVRFRCGQGRGAARGWAHVARSGRTPRTGEACLVGTLLTFEHGALGLVGNALAPPGECPEPPGTPAPRAQSRRTIPAR